MAVLNQVRDGQREVCWTPDFMRLGNLLYLWLWAYGGQADGRERRCLANDSTMPWLDVFPAARERLVVLPHEVRFRDQRVQPWRKGVDPTERYDPPHLNSYCQDILLPALALETDRSERLVVNVRRGDYYSPGNMSLWGFDVATFVQAALCAAIKDGGSPSSVHVVSDDGIWCADHLGFLNEVAPVTFADSDPLSNFRELAQARRVILANSTFSYWAGYVGDILGTRQVIAPTFFNRIEPISVRHLRPHWAAVDAGA